MSEQVQLSGLTVEERAARDAQDLDTEYVYHDTVREYHDGREAALAVAAAAEAVAVEDDNPE